MKTTDKTNEKNIENYLYWKKNKYFYIKNTYCITIPPPNITGNLHMGHAFQYTLMDILIRYHKMKNYATLWKLGTDHAGIATQILVEQHLKNKNIFKNKLGKQTFIKHIWKWKKLSVKNIHTQLKILGCSVNWETERFTLDKLFSYAVKKAFIQLYNENLIYKCNKLVNWDSKLKTAISDLETTHKEETGNLYYIKYYFTNNNNKFLLIATTRPETIFGDTAIAINPRDKKYINLETKTLKIPLSNYIIPIIFDNNVDMQFGSGCVKISPAHDFKDFEIGKNHHLDTINTFTKCGKLNKKTPNKYRNLTIEKAKIFILKDLNKSNLIIKTTRCKHNIPRGDRSNCVIEPLITEQWYINVKPLNKPIINAIQHNKIKIIPNKWKNIFINWIKNMKDWCISRQIWWGHKFPIWYDSQNNIYCGENEKKIKHLYKLKNDINLKQDNNILDTWFSSALWPFASLGWPKKTKELLNFYPTTILITGFDIIFFWAIRMIMFGIKFTNNIPFKEIYIHGLIRDHAGSKMSKTKGNVLDPLDIINGITYEKLIKKRLSVLINQNMKTKIIESTKKYFPHGIQNYGVDALRLTFCSIATHNIAIKIDMEKLKNYKNFCNKLWNAAIFIHLNKKKYNLDNKTNNSFYNSWIISLWEQTKNTFIMHINKKNFPLLSETIYKFTWNEFCNWYIEFSKILLQTKLYKKTTYNTLITIFKEILIVLHPIAPFITEKIWNKFYTLTQTKNKSIITQTFPIYKNISVNKKIKNSIISLKNYIHTIRLAKTKINTKNFSQIIIKLNTPNLQQLILLENLKPLLTKLTKIKHIHITFQLNITTSHVIYPLNKINILIPKTNNTLTTTDNKILIIKKINTIQNNIIKLQATLKHKTFLEKADEKIIKQKKQKLKNLILTHEKLITKN